MISRLTISGGLVGIHQTLTVYSDGGVELRRGRRPERSVRGTAHPEQLEALQQLLASEEWQRARGRYGLGYADAFQYVIVGGGKQVITYDGAQHPEVVQQVLGELQQILGELDKSR